MAMVRDQIDMTYTQGSPQGTPVQQVDRHIPNTTLNPPAAINDINHAVTDGLTFERN
jgi:hypothetical protein